MLPSDHYRTPSLGFVAVDFETANTSLESACALGLACVADGRFRKVFGWGIRPPRDARFTFTHLHGITREAAQTFSSGQSALERLNLELAGVGFAAAHHARFDAAVLHSLSQRLGICLARRPIVCTQRLAQALFGSRCLALLSCAHRLSFPLRHHDPRSDAVACARLVLSASSTRRGRRALQGLLATTTLSTNPDSQRSTPAR